MTTTEFKVNIKEALKYAISEYKSFLDNTPDEYYLNFNGYNNEEIGMPRFRFGVCCFLHGTYLYDKYFYVVDELGHEIIRSNKYQLRTKYKDVAYHNDAYWFRRWGCGGYDIYTMKRSHMARIEVMELILEELDREQMSTNKMRNIISNSLFEINKNEE